MSVDYDVVDALAGLAEDMHDTGRFVERIHDTVKSLKEERDNLRTEVERLREVVRQVHGLAGQGDDLVHGWIDPTLREIHKITKGMVE